MENLCLCSQILENIWNYFQNRRFCWQSGQNLFLSLNNMFDFPKPKHMGLKPWIPIWKSAFPCPPPPTTRTHTHTHTHTNNLLPATTGMLMNVPHHLITNVVFTQKSVMQRVRENAWNSLSCASTLEIKFTCFIICDASFDFLCSSEALNYHLLLIIFLVCIHCFTLKKNFSVTFRRWTLTCK